MIYHSFLNNRDIGKKNFKENKKGIILIKNIFPNTTISSLITLFKKFGKVKRIFFSKSIELSCSIKKNEYLGIICLVEFVKKINAKRLVVIIKLFIYQSLGQLPFQDIFYLKKNKMG